MKVLIALSLCLVVASALPWPPTRPHKTTTTTRRTTTPKHTTTSQHKTTTTPHSTTTPAPGSCGDPAIKPETSKIVGGQDAIPYSWPWQVALFIKPSFGAAYQFCGGTVISPNWVMTAGHCFYGQDSDPTKFQVKAGVFDKTQTNETGEVVVGLSEIHINPQFDMSTITWDITLLKLATPLKFSDHISAVCLPTQGEDLPTAGSPTYVTGWGTTSQGGQDSKTLKQVSVPVVSTDNCEAAYPGQIYPDTQFCAGLEEGGKDSCQGDSGGPVVFQDSKSGTWKQLGIVSWGNGCAQAKYYGVYSKVSAYIDFIHQYVKDL